MTKADIIIIGGGPGGYETALRAAGLGLDVVLIEEDKLGGTCLHEGCIPTKCLCRTAEVLNLFKEAARFGVECSDMQLNIQNALERKERVVGELQSGIAKMLELAKIRLIYGRARFVDRNTVSVKRNMADGDALEFTARHIVIATGSKPVFLPIPGANEPGVVTSRELLSCASVPNSLCIIGGGVIGIEFASIFSAFGSKVSVIEYQKEILPNFDIDLSKRLRLILKKRGIDFFTGSAARAISLTEEGKYSVSYTDKGLEHHTVISDLVLMAVGRSANLDTLNFEEIGISLGKRGIIVDSRFRTSVDNIYAIGDVNGICQLAHAAKYQGRCVVNDIIGKNEPLNVSVIPSVVFSSPEFAMVGKTEEVCHNEGVEYSTRKSYFRANGKAMTLGETDGLVKLVTTHDGTLVGCHILGPHASDLIEEAAVVISKGGKANDISLTVHPHPTLCEVIADAADSQQ